MTATWFVADLHFGHAKVAGLRGYESVEQHDEDILNAWQRQVRPKDIVYVLGDISSGKPEDETHALAMLAYLPGELHLIAGNHDSVSSVNRNGWKNRVWFQEVFESIRDFTHIKSHRRKILLSHFPYGYMGDGINREGDGRYLEYRLPFRGLPLVHGHTHQPDPETDEFQYCVSWDAHRELVPLQRIENYFFGGTK